MIFTFCVCLHLVFFCFFFFSFRFFCWSSVKIVVVFVVTVVVIYLLLLALPLQVLDYHSHAPLWGSCCPLSICSCCCCRNFTLDVRKNNIFYLYYNLFIFEKRLRKLLFVLSAFFPKRILTQRKKCEYRLRKSLHSKKIVIYLSILHYDLS